MTITVAPRRVALILLSLIVLTVVYLVGATRSGGSVATASTGAVSSSSTRSSTIQDVAGVDRVGDLGITVGGRADVAGTPDTLRLDLSVHATATSVSEALAKANGSADAVQKSLLGNGVAKKDLQTSGLTISPTYDYTKSGSPRLKGYEASESLTAKLRDLIRAGAAIGEAVDAGGNAARVNGLSLDLEDADPSPIPVPYQMDAFAAQEKASVPVQPGSQKVGESVTVVFAMG